MSQSWELGILRTLLIAVSALFLVRWIRLRDRGPVIGEDDPPSVERLAKWSCTVDGKRVAGHCATNWWSHFWNDSPYCRDQKAWCDWVGGTYETWG